MSEREPALPFSVTAADDQDFYALWYSQVDGSTFFTFAGRRTDDFRPCGDYMVRDYQPGWSDKLQLIAPLPGQEDLLAHPTDFVWILDDHGSGNPSSIAYYWPIAPQGFVALGVAMGNTDAPPIAENYWCLAQSLCQPTGSLEYWSDRGQHWTSHNGDLSIPFSQTPLQPGQWLPTTVLSDEYAGDTGLNLAMLIQSSPELQDPRRA
ncbi:hypothetical protein [Bradyrhizobium sp.]|uniref:hypothetical protein n=1 Tax=Bradyrhizobium sp. TaxID=376 RepID=UPI001ED06F41|nr:hypothetical protein [Bradyrhizobium sp.]MBV8688449.1 hypothetical protein [Alphaproteobacteria bacterium]MBV9373069.1 hypothetical protein [Alphaproteobacteria bacterium]MBV9979109.1 hypothetical protein [Bradyrhizobium sp.]